MIKDTSEDINRKTEFLESIFNKIYCIKNPLEREYEIIKASHQDEHYTPEEFGRLFEAYCQQKGKLSLEPEISKKLKDEFNKILRIKDLLERQSHLIKASHRQTHYSSEEYFRLFDTYCQKKIRQRLTRAATGFIGIVSSATIIIGVVTFFREAMGREQQLRASAWQVIISNDKTHANAGRKEALEYLNQPSFVWRLKHPFKTGKDDREILSGLEAPNTFIGLVNLKDARLQEANFQKANLYGSNFSGATLSFSNLAEAKLIGASFERANLEKANFLGAVLTDANVKGACFNRANLRGTYLSSSEGKPSIDLADTHFEGAIYDSDTNIQGIIIPHSKKPSKLATAKGMLFISNDNDRDLSKKDLREADLRSAHLKRANLEGTDLEGADLEGADLEEANLKGANLFRVSHLTKDQVLKAKNWEDAIYSDNLREDLEAEYGMKLPEKKFARVPQAPGCITLLNDHTSSKN